MKTLLLLCLLLPSVSFANTNDLSFEKLRQEDLQVFGIAGLISVLSYEARQDNFNFNFNPLNQKLTFNIKF